MTRKLLAELLGTSILVYVGCGTAAQLLVHRSTPIAAVDVLATAVAFGVVLMLLGYALAPISGAHVNPAVTLGMWLTGQVRVGQAMGYVLAQFCGGVLGALALWGTFRASPAYAGRSDGLFANGYGRRSVLHVGATGAFCVEVALTCVLVFVVVAVSERGPGRAASGIATGVTFASVYVLGIVIDNASANPARSFGPALLVGGVALRQVWLFVLAPLVGGALAAVALRATAPVAAVRTR